MKNEQKSLRTIRKSWSSLSIADEVLTRKELNKNKPGKIERKPTKLDYFPELNLKISVHKENKFIFNPDSGVKIFWDFVVLNMLVIKLFIIPYEICVASRPFEGSKLGILLTDIIFIIDICVRFNTGIQFKGFLITSRTLIFKKYFKGLFWIDLFASVPFQELSVFSSASDSSKLFGIHYIKFLLIIKLANFYRIKHTVYLLEDRFTSLNSLTTLRFFHFSLHILLLLHWTSCIVHLLYIRDLQYSGDMWDKYIESEGIRYLNYFYFILFTVTSIGYYALNISTYDQQLLIIIIMCFDIIIFAYMLGKIESTLNSFQKENNETKKLLSKCKAFISQNNIPNDLRHKILRYIVFCREAERKIFDKENEILSNLSIPLREEIFTNTRGHILSHSVTFSIYPKTFLKFIGFHLRLQIFGPDDIIFESGENSSIIYFIQQGNIEIFHSSTSTVFKELRNGKCFGEIAFFLGSIRTASARSVSFTELLVLNRTDFNKILNYRPFEKNITEQLVIEAGEKGLSVLRIKCYFCHNVGHIAATCKSYVIHLDLKKAGKKIESSKFKNTKKVNLNDSFNFTFQRSESGISPKHLKVHHSYGKPLDVNKAYSDRPGLLKKAKNFRTKPRVVPLIVKSPCFSLLDDSSSEEVEGSPLPNCFQYRRTFMEISKNRAGIEQKRAIELFDVGDFPKIYLSSC